MLWKANISFSSAILASEMPHSSIILPGEKKGGNQTFPFQFQCAALVTSQSQEFRLAFLLHYNWQEFLDFIAAGGGEKVPITLGKVV